jgi:hypothetical protein
LELLKLHPVWVPPRNSWARATCVSTCARASDAKFSLIQWDLRHVHGLPFPVQLGPTTITHPDSCVVHPFMSLPPPPDLNAECWVGFALAIASTSCCGSKIKRISTALCFTHSASQGIAPANYSIFVSKQSIVSSTIFLIYSLCLVTCILRWFLTIEVFPGKSAFPVVWVELIPDNCFFSY